MASQHDEHVDRSFEGRVVKVVWMAVCFLVSSCSYIEMCWG